MTTANGATRYLAVNAFNGKQPKRKDTPPLAKEFIGDPKVTIDVYPSDRVDFFVEQQVKMKATGNTVNDIYRVKVPRRGQISVKRYPAFVGRSQSLGPKAPPLWKTTKDVPKEALEAIEAAVPSIWNQVDRNRRNALVGALERLSIDFEIKPKAKTAISHSMA